MPVTALIQKDDAAIDRQVVRDEGEVVGRAGEAVDQHQRRGTGRAGATVRPCQLDPVDRE
jgi:hypothetical protein